MSIVVCPQCNSENQADRLNCETCGSPLPLEDNNTRSADRDGFEEGVLDGLDDWLQELDDLPEVDDKSEITEIKSDDSSIPTQDLQGSAANAAQEDTEDLLNWLQEQEPDEVSSENLVDPRSDKYSLAQTQPLTSYHEIEEIPEQLASSDLPDWLVAPATAEEIEPVVGDSQDNLDDEIELRAPLISSAAISASLQEDPPESTEQDSATTDWYAEMADTDLESALDEMLDQPAESTEGAPADVWLDLVDEIPISDQSHLSTEGEAGEPPHEDDDAEIPDWLQALKPETMAYATAKDESVEISGPLSGLSGVIPIATADSVREKAREAGRYTMTKEQRQQVALLRQLTTDVPEKVTKESESRVTDSFFSIRLILGLLLLVLVIAGWYLPPISSLLPWLDTPSVSTATEGAYNAINDSTGSPVLVAFEYTPAMAGELDTVALAMLSHIAQNDSPVVVVSQFAAGIPVSQRVLEEVEGLEYFMLGYLPGEATGLRLLGSCLSATEPCQEIANISDAQDIQESLANVGLVVVISGDREGLVNWIEQVGTQTEMPMIAGITQGIQPIADPYLKSDQLEGVVEGMPAAATYEREYLDSQGFAAKSLTSVTLSQWLAVITIVVGSLYYGISGTIASSGKKIGIR